MKTAEVCCSEAQRQGNCDLGSMEAHRYEEHFEGTFEHGDEKVFSEILVTKAMRR